MRHCGAALRRTCAGAYAMGPGGSSPPRAIARSAVPPGARYGGRRLAAAGAARLLAQTE